jgi:hypothetical protein
MASAFIVATVFAGTARPVKALPSQVTVTVDSVTYRLALLGDGPGSLSYNDAIGINTFVPFDQTSWWNTGTSVIDGNLAAQELPEAIAEAVAAATTSEPASVAFRVPYETFTNAANQDRVRFGTATGDGSNARSRSRVVSFTNSGDFPDAVPQVTQHVWVTEVPEIDGPVLAQALFALGTLYALLHGRFRRRVDSA